MRGIYCGDGRRARALARPGAGPRRPPRRHPRPDPGSAGQGRLRAQRVPRPRASPRRVSRVLRVPRRADAQGRRAIEGRARDDRRRDQRRQRLPVLRGRPRRDPPDLRQEPADRRPGRGQLPQGRRDAAPPRDARLRGQGRAARRRGRRDRLRAAARARILRRGRLGHRRDRRVLRDEQPAGQHDRHAPERRVLPDGARPQALTVATGPRAIVGYARTMRTGLALALAMTVTTAGATTARAAPDGAPPAIELSAARTLLPGGGDDCGDVACLIERAYRSDPKARALAMALWTDGGHVAGVGAEEIMDGGYRGKIHLVPQLPTGSYRQHLAWVADAMRSIDRFFTDVFAGQPAPRYRWRALAFRFVRSIGKRTPSAYASSWAIEYNVEGSLLTSAAGVRDTLIHELFHVNDEDHGDWSGRH